MAIKIPGIALERLSKLNPMRELRPMVIVTVTPTNNMGATTPTVVLKM